MYQITSLRYSKNDGVYNIYSELHFFHNYWIYNFFFNFDNIQDNIDIIAIIVLNCCQ